MEAVRGKADKPTDSDYKRRAQEHWTANPCGTEVAREIERGSRDYFDSIEAYRYGVYAPWMKETIGFDRYAGKRVLEVGCGAGTDLVQFARGGALVTGVDLTAKSLELTRRRFKLYGLGAEFAVADAESLNFPDNTFDLVYSFGVLHHTPRTEEAIAEIHRVLKPGGEAIVMLYNRTSVNYWGAIILKRGILRGQLLKQSPSEIMSRSAEYVETDAGPLVKVYTRSQAVRMFRRFARCTVEVNQMSRDELKFLGPLLPETVFQSLIRRFGWNLIIKAVKSE